MSERHPIIAITGSSGAGTTSVTRTFDAIFRRENVKAAVIEGDPLSRVRTAHRLADRAEMLLQTIRQQLADGIRIRRIRQAAGEIHPFQIGFLAGKVIFQLRQRPFTPADRFHLLGVALQIHILMHQQLLNLTQQAHHVVGNNTS